MEGHVYMQGLPTDDFIEFLAEKVAEKLLTKMQATSMDEAKFLSIDETRKQFYPPVTKATIHNWAAKGYLKKHRIGSKVVFDRDEVQQAAQTLQKYKHIQ